MTVSVGIHRIVEGFIQSDAASFEEVTVSGNLKAETITAGLIRTPSMEVETLKVTRISSPTGIITIDGNLVLSKDHPKEAFLQVQEHHDGHHRHRHGKKCACDSFNSGHQMGWKDGLVDAHVDKCLFGDDYFLVGSTCSSSGRLSKTFEDLPPHSHLKVRARVHFIDAWKGESVYLQTSGGSIVWMDSAVSPSLEAISKGKALNVCGGESPDARLSVHVEVTLSHVDPTFELTFASTLGDGNCDASFGVDDVVIHSFLNEEH